MRLNQLGPARGAVKRKKRVGCGPGSGHGKRSTRGNKGQRARNTVSMWFEGGQMPLQRRLPKRGFKNPTRVENQVVNLDRIAEHFTSGEEVNPETLFAKRLVRRKGLKIKVLGKGEVGVALKVTAHAISDKARETIEKAGGTVNIID
ncbi:MAG: 50S ribosomal protein L15 [bacterium]